MADCSFLRRLSGYGNQVDAVAIARSIRQIVTQVRSIDRHAFSIRQDTDIVPVNFGIAKAVVELSRRIQVRMESVVSEFSNVPGATTRTYLGHPV